MRAINAGWSAFRDPGQLDRQEQGLLVGADYSRAWAYYRNDSDAVYPPDYVSARELYTHTRLLFNPVPRIVDFYQDHLLPSVGETLDDGAVLVTPLINADEEIKRAVAQLDQWSNWLSLSLRMIKWCAATGDVLVENVDEVEREAITHRVVWGSHVDRNYLVRDAQGNVKEYALEYKVWDSKWKETYTYRKEADQDEFRYFRDGKPFDYASESAFTEGARVKNPYGFVPAVWIAHEDDGSSRGLAAFSSPVKLDEVNSLASHAHDHGHKRIVAPKVLATDGTLDVAIGGKLNEDKTVSVSADVRTDWLLLKTTANASLLDLAGAMAITELDPSINRLLQSFVDDNPELQAAELIRNNSQLSGAALERLLGPSQTKLDHATANYFPQIVKLKQMGLAMGGYRANNGDWTRRDAQREAFRPFGLDSYRQGDLDFGLRRSLLIQPTELEEAELRSKRLENAKNAEGILDELERVMLAGYGRQEAIEIIARRAEIDPVVLAKQYDDLAGEVAGDA